MQGRLLLGVGVLLAAIWWVAGSSAVGWSECQAAETDTVTEPPEPATGTHVADLSRELVVDATKDDVGLPARPRPRRPAPPLSTMRDILVLDQFGQSVIGAELSVGTVFDSNGDRRGNGASTITDRTGRTRMALAADTWVHVCAEGLGLATAKVPDEDGEWTITLTGALRLEITVVGPADFTGFHARVLLPPSCPTGAFYQSKYVQTPGRAVSGTVARWASVLEGVGEPKGPQRRCSNWEVCLTPGGTATLDQIEGTGTVRVQLMHFARLLEERSFEIRHSGAPVRMRFTAAPPPTLRGVVVDTNGRPVPDVCLRMAPFGGRRIVDSPKGYHEFPVWAPRALSDHGGRFALPRPDEVGERVVVSRAGYAARAMTVAEIDAGGGTIELQRGRRVRLEVVDCNGAPLEGGYTTGGHEYAEPGVHLGHDVWRGARDDELPWFEFAELPPREVAFRCAGETLRHDARVPLARLTTEGPVEEMGIGK